MMPFAAMRMRGSASPGSAWNPLDMGSGIALSSSDTVATNSGTYSFRIVRSLISHNTGKRYAEIELVSGEIPNPWNGFLGIANASESLTGNYLGQTVNSHGLQCDDNGGAAGNARLFYNGAEINRVGAIAAGGYARIAIDFDAGQGWIGNASTYVSGGSPAAGTTPSFTFTPGSSRYLAAALNRTGGVAAARVRTAALDMVGTMPSGFGPWG